MTALNCIHFFLGNVSNVMHHIQTLSAQSVVIILPAMGKALDIPDSRLQWIVSAYSLTFGCFLLLWGRIADIFGKRFIFIAGSIWVTIATAVNPFMPNEIAFDFFRGLHGLVGILFYKISIRSWSLTCF